MKKTAKARLEPEIAHTADGIIWADRASRFISESRELGFPVWGYREPRIIDSFLEQEDLPGKHIILFATSGAGGFERWSPVSRDFSRLMPLLRQAGS